MWTIFLVFKYLLYPFRKEPLSFCLLQKAKLNDFLKTNAVTFANLPALLCLISLVCLIFSDYLNEIACQQPRVQGGGWYLFS